MVITPSQDRKDTNANHKALAHSRIKRLTGARLPPGKRRVPRSPEQEATFVAMFLRHRQHFATCLQRNRFTYSMFFQNSMVMSQNSNSYEFEMTVNPQSSHRYRSEPSRETYSFDPRATESSRERSGDACKHRAPDVQTSYFTVPDFPTWQDFSGRRTGDRLSVA